AALLVLLKLWQPKTVLGYGGVPVDAAAARQTQSHGLKSGEVLQAWLPFVVLLVVVGLWTGPWWGDHSPTKISLFKAQAVGCSALASTCTAAKPSVTAVFNFTPLIAGTAILTTWIIVAVLLIAMGRLKGSQLGEVLRRSFHQMWGACLVGVFIFGLAYTFNYSGMAASLAKGFSSMGTAFIIVAPVLGFIGVARSCQRPGCARLRAEAVTTTSERVDPGELPPDGELMDGLGAFVRDDALEIQHVADGHVLGADAGAAQHVAAVARDVERHAAVVPLGERDVRGLHRACVLEPSELQRQQLRGRDAPGHLGEPNLDGLVRGERPAEERPGRGVVEQLPEARLRGSDHAPGDAVARLREAGEGTLQSHHARQHAFLRHHDVVEVERGGDRGTQRELVLDLGCRETRSALLDEEAADALGCHRPHEREVGDRAVGDPHLRAVHHPVAAALLC